MRIYRRTLLVFLLGGVVLAPPNLASSLQAVPQSPQQTQAKIVSLFQEARQAERRNDFAEADRLYDAILQLDPSLAEVWTNKGLVLYELSKHREALSAFAKAARLKPKLLTPHLFLGIEYLKLAEPRKALAPLKVALALEPRHPQATYELANAYAQLEQFELAMRTYRDLLQRNPQMEQAWYRLGICYLNWSKSAARKLVDAPVRSPYAKLLLAELQAVGSILVDAEANYRAVVAALPHSPEPRLALGSFYSDFDTGPERVERAREQFEKAKSLAPRDPLVTMMKVRLALRQENYAEALAGLKEVLEADFIFAQRHLSELLVGFTPEDLRKVIAGVCPGETPGSGTVACSGRNGAVPALLYASYSGLGDTKHAAESLRALEELAKKTPAKPARTQLQGYGQRLSQLEKASRSRELSPRERVDLAVCSYRLGVYERALRALLAVLKSSRNDQALYWLSLTCRALARETFLEAIKTNPNSYRSHLLLADLARDRHDTAGALAEYEKALELGADDPEVHLFVIQFLRSEGKEDEALVKAGSAVERFPAHPGLNCELGKLLLRKRNAQESRLHFQRALAADPTLASARAGLADSYAALGQTAKAIQEMKQALSADSDGSYHYRLGRWLQQAGQSREASEAFATSTKLKQGKLKRDVERFATLRPHD